MRILIALLLVSAVFCEMLTCKEYVEYLKKTVSWEVQEYEDNVFRGWTVEEAKNFLGLESFGGENFPEVEHVAVPSEISWARADCDHGPKNQGQCGSCWAFAATGMLSDRCCIQAKDNGWLSPQELVSCDKSSHGCQGGSLESPINYMQKNGGLVPDACFPYTATNKPCPTKCADGSDWKGAHVCKCSNPLTCSGTSGIKSCLTTGPVVIGFYVCQSFMSYKGGVYKCDCTNYLGGHAVLVMGASETPECNFHVKNSWGTSWGLSGYFDIACTTCRLVGGSVCGKVSN